MRHLLTFITLLVPIHLAFAQPAVLELPGVRGERTTPFVSIQNELHLHKQPNLESATVVIPYNVGWRVPTSARQGLTRILTIGELRVTNPDEELRCSTVATEGPSTLVHGETVEYVRYLGEGFGEIRFRGANCEAEVIPKLGHFELVVPPVVQAWLPVYFADGTSPGWLLNDGTQVR